MKLTLKSTEDKESEKVVFKFRKGDTILFNDGYTQRIGTVENISKGWNPPLYLILFEGERTPRWMPDKYLINLNPSRR